MLKTPHRLDYQTQSVRQSVSQLASQSAYPPPTKAIHITLEQQQAALTEHNPCPRNFVYYRRGGRDLDLHIKQHCPIIQTLTGDVRSSRYTSL